MRKFIFAVAVVSLCYGVSSAAFAVNYTAAPASVSKEDSTAKAGDIKADSKAESQTQSQSQTQTKGSAPVKLSFAQKLEELNKGNPMNNPAFEASRKLLKRRIADSEGITVGEVRDVLIAQGGEVEMVIALFNRLHLSQEALLNVQDMQIKTLENRYQLGFNSKDIKIIFPEVPKELSDSDKSKFITVKDIKRKRLETTRGDKIGKIEDILFSEDGMQVKAAIVKVNYGPVRNKYVAVPFENIIFGKKRGHFKFYISSENALDIVKLASSEKPEAPKKK